MSSLQQVLTAKDMEPGAEGCHLQMPRESYFSAVRYEDDLLIMSKSVCSSCLEGTVPGIHSDSPLTTSLNRRICIFLDARSLCRFLVLDSASRTGALEFANGLLAIHKLRAQQRRRDPDPYLTLTWERFVSRLSITNV